MEMKLPT